MGLFSERAIEGYSWRKKHGEPKNRRQLFVCVLTEQFSSLIGVNMLYLVFCIPAIAWSGLCLLQMAAGVREENGSALISAIQLWMIGLLPCLTLLGPAKAGMALVMRNWAREDYTKPVSTFVRGMRENWKQTILCAAAEGALPLAIWSACRVAAAGEGAALLWAACIAAVLYEMAMQVFYVLVVSYDLRAWQHLRNAVLLLFMKLPAFALVLVGNLFFVIVGAAAMWLNPGSWDINLLVPVAYYCVVGFAITALAQASLANWLCDTYLSGKETVQ